MAISLQRTKRAMTVAPVAVIAAFGAGMLLGAGRETGREEVAAARG